MQQLPGLKLCSVWLAGGKAMAHSHLAVCGHRWNEMPASVRRAFGNGNAQALPGSLVPTEVVVEARGEALIPELILTPATSVL